MVKRIFILGWVVVMAGCSLIPQNWKVPEKLTGAWQFKDSSQGPLVLTFRKNQTFEVDYNADGKKDIWGQYELWEKRIKLTDDKPRVITDCFEPGFYYYSIKNYELHFDLLADHCRPRKYVLSLPMVRRPSASSEKK